jgi:hypothetical protein
MLRLIFYLKLFLLKIFFSSRQSHVSSKKPNFFEIRDTLDQKYFPSRKKCERKQELATGLPDFSRHNLPKQGKMYQITTALTNGHKIYQMAAKYFKWQ